MMPSMLTEAPSSAVIAPLVLAKEVPKTAEAQPSDLAPQIAAYFSSLNPYGIKHGPLWERVQYGDGSRIGDQRAIKLIQDSMSRLQAFMREDARESDERLKIVVQENEWWDTGLPRWKLVEFGEKKGHEEFRIMTEYPVFPRADDETAPDRIQFSLTYYDHNKRRALSFGVKQNGTFGLLVRYSPRASRPQMPLTRDSIETTSLPYDYAAPLKHIRHVDAQLVLMHLGVILQQYVELHNNGVITVPDNVFPYHNVFDLEPYHSPIKEKKRKAARSIYP